MPNAHTKHRGWVLSPRYGLLAAIYRDAQENTSALGANTAVDGIFLGTPVVPALAVDSLVISNMVANGDILLAANNGGNSQAWLWVDASAGTLSLYGAGTRTAIISSTAIAVQDDILLGLGTGSTARFSWDTTDANANALLLQMPAGGAVDVPLLAIGQSIESVDLGLYNGLVDPRIAMFGVGAVTTGPGIDFRKARGTIASPTVVTTGDDLGTIRAYGAVAAGEYVQAAEIRFDMAGTIATTRGPGTITFLTATDAAPSSLVQALLISAAQLVTAASLTSTGAFTASSTSALNGNVTVADDILLGIGTGNTARLSWDTTDANANALLLQMPAGGATDVPVLAIGQSIESVDLGLFNGVVDPTIAIFGVGAVTTGARLRVYKARGTIAAPTAITTGDDLFGISAYAAVDAGEYVESARMEFDSTGTIATTRGPGLIRFSTTPDAAAGSLTTRLTIGSEGQLTVAATTTPASIATTPGTAASAVLTITGGLGGDTTIGTTGVGGVGSGFSFTAGAGGIATAATTAATGGAGGAFAFTTGAGGAEAVAGVTATGGAGGAVTVTTGAGGAVSAAVSGTATGGAAGLLTIRGGVGGAVTATTGTNVGGAGGGVSVIAGAGGAASGATDTGGAGGIITVTPGAGGAGDANAAGKPGYVNITTSYTRRSVQTIDMADAAVTLTVNPGNPAGTLMTSDILYVDANSATTENLLLPLEADLTGIILVIVNTGGETINIQNDAGGAVLTLETANTAVITCDGTTLRGVVGVP